MAEETYNQGYRVDATKEASTYAAAYDATTGTMFENPSGLLCQHQARFPAGSYLRFVIDRTFLYWATGALPDGCTITNVDLQIYVRLKWTQGRTFKIVVQNGQPDFPHAPAIAGDYYRIRYSGNGGEIASGDIVTDAWNTITLNADGISWINKEGWTKLVLRVDREINGDAPTTPSEGGNNAEGIQMYSDPVGGIYAKLVITFTVNEITTQATSQISYQCAMGNGTIVAGEPTIRGFEILLSFAGTLNNAIGHNIAGFVGDVTFVVADGNWQGTLTKTESETGTYTAGAYELVLGYPSVLGNPSSVFDDKLFKCESYTYRAYMVIGEVTFYGAYVAFDTLCDAGGDQQPTDDISEGDPTVPIIPIEDITIDQIEPYPPFEYDYPPDIPYPPWDFYYPPWDWDFPNLPDIPPWILPDLPPWEIPDYPPMSFVGDFYYKKPYTQKDLDELRKKCIIYNKNSVEFALVLRHNMNVLKEFFNMMTDYMGKEEFNDFTDLIPPQRLKELYLDNLEVNDFKDMINGFIRNTVDNNIAVNRNFGLIQLGLSAYETGSDAYFSDIYSAMTTVTEDNPDVDTLKRVVDNLNQEVASNFNVIMKNLKVIRARLL